MKKFIIICCVFAFSFAESCDMPEPYRSINVLPFDGNEVCFQSENKRNLKEIILSNDIHVVIELGSWLGASVLQMAKFLPVDGKIYVVDDWLWSGPFPNATTRYPYPYRQFLSNIIHKNLTHKVIPIRMKTTETAKALNVKADLIYIDAAHDENSVFTDIMNWFPKLKKDGIMCGDDWYKNFPGVVRAVQRAAKRLNLNIRHDGQFWWFESK